MLTQGIDLVNVKRMQHSIESAGKSFLNRVFTAREQRYCESKRMKYEHYAARFAAKEAAMKAFEITAEHSFRFRDIEVRRASTGKPFIYLSPSARKKFGIPSGSQIQLSMTHERDAAMAVVILIKSPKKNSPLSPTRRG